MTAKETAAAFRRLAELAAGKARADAALKESASCLDVMNNAIELVTGHTYNTGGERNRAFIEYANARLGKEVVAAITGGQPYALRAHGPLAIAVAAAMKGTATSSAPSPAPAASVPSSAPARVPSIAEGLLELNSESAALLGRHVFSNARIESGEAFLRHAFIGGLRLEGLAAIGKARGWFEPKPVTGLQRVLRAQAQDRLNHALEHGLKVATPTANTGLTGLARTKAAIERDIAGKDRI